MAFGLTLVGHGVRCGQCQKGRRVPRQGRQSPMDSWVEWQKFDKVWATSGVVQRRLRVWSMDKGIDGVAKMSAPAQFWVSPVCRSPTWLTSEPLQTPSVWCRFVGFRTSEPFRTILMTVVGIAKSV